MSETIQNVLGAIQALSGAMGEMTSCLGSDKVITSLQYYARESPKIPSLLFQVQGPHVVELVSAFVERRKKLFASVRVLEDAYRDEWEYDVSISAYCDLISRHQDDTIQWDPLGKETHTDIWRYRDSLSELLAEEPRKAHYQQLQVTTRELVVAVDSFREVSSNKNILRDLLKLSGCLDEIVNRRVVSLSVEKQIRDIFGKDGLAFGKKLVSLEKPLEEIVRISRGLVLMTNRRLRDEVVKLRLQYAKYLHSSGAIVEMLEKERDAVKDAFSSLEVESGGSESLVVLMLRAVVFEHTLMVTRRFTQCGVL